MLYQHFWVTVGIGDGLSDDAQHASLRDLLTAHLPTGAGLGYSVKRFQEIHGLKPDLKAVLRAAIGAGFARQHADGIFLANQPKGWHLLPISSEALSSPDTTPANHGAIWSQEDCSRMLEMIRDGVSLRRIGQILKRKPDACWSKIQKLTQTSVTRYGNVGVVFLTEGGQAINGVWREVDMYSDASEALTDCHHPSLVSVTSSASASASASAINTVIATPFPNLIPETSTFESIIMSKPLIETRTFIRDTDASTLSDAQIIDLIGTIESRIKKLRSIETSSTKIAAVIKAQQDDLAKLVAYFDAR